MPTIVRLSRPPPSTNALYANIPGKGRIKTKAYKAWLTEMGWEIKLQKLDRVAGRVDLDIEVERKSSRSDLGNREKAATDLLVSMQVIDDDRFVRKISMLWAEIKGCHITISSVSESTDSVSKK